MKKQKDPLEELNQQSEPNKGINKKYNLTTLVVVVVTAIAVTVASFYLYNSYQDKTDGEVVVITADDNEIKVKPENPGGMVVDNMDKIVYDTITGQVVEEEAPKILPAAEEPVDKNLMLEKDNSKESKEPQEAKEEVVLVEPVINNEITVNEVVEVTEEPSEKSSADLKEKKLAEKYNKDKVLTKKEENYIKPIAKDNLDSEKLSKANPQLEKFYKVQIASFRTKSDAEKEWITLSKRHPKLIGIYQNYIVAKNIEGKGMFYRLQIGPFKSHSEASKACKAIKNVGLSCLIVKP